MKKIKNELRHEYKREDLGSGIRGKYLKAYQLGKKMAGTNLVLLKPEVAAMFPTEKSVNDALMALIQLAKHSINLSRRSNG